MDPGEEDDDPVESRRLLDLRGSDKLVRVGEVGSEYQRWSKNDQISPLYHHAKQLRMCMWYKQVLFGISVV